MSPSQVSQVSQVVYTVALTAAVVETSTVFILCGDRIDFTSLYLCVFKTFEDVVLSSVMNI